MQYVLMFLSGGQPGLAKDLQVKVAAARKVFRIMKVCLTCSQCVLIQFEGGQKRHTISGVSNCTVVAPTLLTHAFMVPAALASWAQHTYRLLLQPLETLTPLLKEPYLPCKKALHQELLPKIRSACMAAYFAFDHLVWLGSVNVITDKRILERCVFTAACFYCEE